MYVFFFSSRRRHTRWPRDWSSDVCSSDLKEARKGTASNGKPFLTLFFVDATGEIDAKLWDAKPEDEEIFTDGKITKIVGDRSEERRVGKECRSGWSRDNYIKR